MKKNEQITGDSLADSLNSIILFTKIQAIKNKMKEYKQNLDKMTVDIPEFCKPKEEQFENIINFQIVQMIRNNTLDYFYQQAIN